MSSHSYTEVCPVCNGELETNTSNRPFDQSYGECLKCGFGYNTVVFRHDLETLNELRAERNFDLGEEEDEETLEQLTQDDYESHSDHYLFKNNL